MARTALAGLALLICTASASAQDSAPEDGLGPYRFGMSSAEARATAPNANWIVEHEDGREILTGGPNVALGGRMNAALVFVDDALRRLILVAAAPGDCVAAVTAMVETLEPLYGRFASLAPHALEEGRLTRVAQTEFGSEVRAREIEGQGATVASARYGAMYAVVQGRPEANAGDRCRLTVTFGPPSDWVRSEPNAGPTWAQLDAAQSLPDPDWRRRPNGGSFVRVYPRNALERNVDGAAVLDCLVVEEGRLSCLVVHEQPTGWGFGAAALDIARDFRVDQSVDGTPALGRRVRIPIRFNVA